MNKQKTMLVWKKILMDWWDRGGLSDSAVTRYMVDQYIVSPIPATREEWEDRIERELTPLYHDIHHAFALLEKPVDIVHRGLCYSSFFYVPALVRMAIFHQWEHFSGNFTYPVPGHFTRADQMVTEPFEVYQHYYARQVLYTGEYGEKRMQLKQYVADVIRATIAHIEQNIE